ncbi:hypothetical protein [Apibacter sp. HY039]|uniref:hypothetical protein n=1 Tax=Apibacter sp. HY039 TaxID=2501476 RepID=UPI000FEBE35E|nr:hypothetical protein [Apibacter sp. HY039]
MKKEQVPQDEGNLVKSNIKDLYYAVDEEGKYTTVLSTGWEAKTLAQDESMDLIKERVEDARSKVLAGELSPIAYYMEVNKMDVSILSSYTHIWSWFVKRHMKPANFYKLKTKTLQKYAEAFGINIEQLKDISKYPGLQQ